MAIDIIKPNTDKATYLRYDLSNGLRTLLISDKTAVKGSATLAYDIAVPTDPEELGVAPSAMCAAERFLVLGSEKVRGTKCWAANDM